MLHYFGFCAGGKKHGSGFSILFAFHEMIEADVIFAFERILSSPSVEAMYRSSFQNHLFPITVRGRDRPSQGRPQYLPLAPVAST